MGASKRQKEAREEKREARTPPEQQEGYAKPGSGHHERSPRKAVKEQAGHRPPPADNASINTHGEEAADARCRSNRDCTPGNRRDDDRGDAADGHDRRRRSGVRGSRVSALEAESVQAGTSEGNILEGTLGTLTPIANIKPVDGNTASRAAYLV